MTLFKSRKFVISEREPTYKVKYIGNVQTTLMRGDGCTDKSAVVLWNNYLKTNNAIDMKLSVCSSGLKALTKEQGLTEYRAHRISYCIAHPNHPKVFIWVYRHEAKKLKIELRCHAVLCRSDSMAKAIALQLHEKLSAALSEFLREKSRKQNSRLAVQRKSSFCNSLGGSGGVSVASGMATRTKFLSTGQNFKPSIEKSNTAPKLGSISEDMEGEIMEKLDEEEDDEDYHDIIYGNGVNSVENEGIDGELLRDYTGGAKSSFRDSMIDFFNKGILELEVGNNLEELRKDKDVLLEMIKNSDSDNDSIESETFADENVDKSSFRSASKRLPANQCAGGATNSGRTNVAPVAHTNGLSCLTQTLSPKSTKKLRNGSGEIHPLYTDNDKVSLNL